MTDKKVRTTQFFGRTLFLIALTTGMMCARVNAEPKFNATNTTAPTPNHTDSGENERGDERKPSQFDCTRPNTDARCRPLPTPQHYPTPYRPRPVIINQLPPQPTIEINTLNDDWEGCRKAKLGAIRERDSGHADAANRLDEWLWKSCRSYSNELRQLEQDGM